ncbi:polymorphic toxin-type HINT domain-containing protein [Leptospira adleri]|uniref:polymorphic toxin-type HINT domain-containing protein n=1 Tax=Leptospira adleri TaxID=2023186 RepID=UPI001FD27D10|nr:polymorphic toxin-type HINT domain-containing protein [Leptospira adleri]
MSCFVAGTQVHLSNSNTKNIEEIVVGDVVRSWNEKTNTFESKRVTELFVHEVPQLFYLELDGEEEIHTTWNHPFRRRNKTTVVDANAPQLVMASALERRLEKEPSENSVQVSEWVKVEDLRLRDQVLKSDGSWAEVTGIFHYNVEPTKVYNIEVEENHTYIVGESASNAGYVVHNYNNAQEAMFGQFKRLSKDMFNVAKEFAGLEGGFGKEIYQKAARLEQDVASTNMLRESLQKESNGLTVKRDSAQGKIEMIGLRNGEFLAAIHSSKSNDLSGIAELRKELKGANPKKGFTESEMKSVSKWMEKNGWNDAGIKSGFGNPSGLGFGGMSKLSDSHISGFIKSAALNIVSSKEHGNLVEIVKDSTEKLAQHKIKEDNIGKQMIERSERAKAELVKLVQERHGNDPKYAEVLVEHGLVKRDGLNPTEPKVSYDEKLKAMGDKIKPDTQKKLAEYDRKITDLRVSQNKHEAESYAQWQKDHPNEPYKRTPEMEKRRNDMAVQQKKLEQERNTLINREVAPFTKENELHRLEKLADANAISEKQKNDLAVLKNEKKTHETQVAALLDKDNATMHNNLETVFGKERMSIANDRADLAQNLLAKEDKLRTLDPKKDKVEYDKLNKEVKGIQERTAQLDKNFLEYKPVREAKEPLDIFLLREKDSFAGEPKAIERIVDGLEEQKKHYKALGDVAKVKEVQRKIDDYTARSIESFKRSKDDELTLALRKGGKERENALRDMEEYLTHADDRDSKQRERELPISKTLKNPAGNPEGKTISVNSHFGRGGYSNQEVVGTYLHSNDHIGLDVGGPKGERINSVLEGKVKYPPTKGLSITIPGDMPSHLKGIAYSEPVYDGNGNKTRNGGYYDSSGNSYTADKLREMDTKYRKANPGLSKGEPLFEATRSVGVITENGKFYTMANAKTPVELTPAQLALVPEEIRRNPGLVHPSGNSLAIETTLTGVFAGKYEVQYKHFDSAPRYENGDLVKAGDTVKPGQKIGDLGTTGRSTGAHLHMSVVSYEKPNGVSSAFYEPVKQKGSNKVLYYLINPQYFMKVMAPSGARK